MIKSRCRIIMIAVLALLGISASAQTYSIRVQYNSNIRAQPSLSGQRLETVPAGTVLQVLAEFNKWFKVNRGGEAWMAGWVSHERVAGAQTAATDNCCGVDRQCQQDSEWVAGYWAFQRGECASPSADTRTEASTLSQSKADVNNCCFTGWDCHTQSEWIAGYNAFQHNQCEHGLGSSASAKPGGGHAPIRVGELSAGFAAYVARGFDLLRTRAPHWYSYTVNALSGVQEIHNCCSSVDPGSAIAYFHHLPYAGRPTNYQDDITMAEFLVHEACHVYQHREGRMNHSCPMVYDEFECEAKSLEASLLIDPNSWNIAGKREFLAHGHNPCR